MPWQVQGRRRGGGRCAVAAGRRAALRCASPRHPRRDEGWKPEPSRATVPRRTTPRHPTPHRNAERTKPTPGRGRRGAASSRTVSTRAALCHAMPRRAVPRRAAPRQMQRCAMPHCEPSQGTPHRAEPYQTLGPCCANPIRAARKALRRADPLHARRPASRCAVPRTGGGAEQRGRADEPRPAKPISEPSRIEPPLRAVPTARGCGNRGSVISLRPDCTPATRGKHGVSGGLHVRCEDCAIAQISRMALNRRVYAPRSGRQPRIVLFLLLPEMARSCSASLRSEVADVVMGLSGSCSAQRVRSSWCRVTMVARSCPERS